MCERLGFSWRILCHGFLTNYAANAVSLYCSVPVESPTSGVRKLSDLHCLNDSDSDRITLHANIRGTTSPSSRYEVQATLDLHDELFLARYCSCPAFNGSQHGYGTYSSAYSPSYRNNPKLSQFRR